MGRCTGTAVRAAIRSVASAASVSLLAGCGLVGGPTTLSQDAPEKLTITSPAFGEGMIPRQYTCHGVGKSPPIYWSGAPQGTRSLALVVDDSDAPITPYVYWIVFNISPTTDIQAGRLPQGARVATNSKGIAGYSAPCPDGSHQYRFTVYALNSMLSLPDRAPLEEGWIAVAEHAIARGRLTAVARS